MRILHVVATGQRRGAEMFAHDLIRELPHHGRFDQAVAILRGPWPPAVSFDAPVIGPASSAFRLPGLRIDTGTLQRLRRALKRFRPDVVHAHGAEAFKYLVLATVFSRVPIVYRRIGSAPDEITRGMRRTVHAAFLRRSDRVVAVAEAVRQETIETFGIGRAHIVTIPRGIDPGRLEAERGRAAIRDEVGVGPSAPVIIAVGALSEEKDPLAHLDLCAELVRTWPDLVYLFAGDGPMRADVERAIEQRGLAPYVRLLGVRSDIGDVLAASDVLVLASRTEGMPGCVIEAGMAGLPVVAYGVAGVPEVLLDGVTGYVVRPGDHGCLTERVASLLADPVRRRVMGDAAAERCRATYGIDEIAERYVEVYAEVLA